MKIKFYGAIDKWLGTPLCVVLGGLSKLFPKQKCIIAPKKILILKLWAIGDSVVSLPMIRSLKLSFPNAKIDVLARKRNAAVFENNGDINKIILFEPKHLIDLLALFRKYDLVIDAEPWMRLSALLSMFAGRRRIGFGKQARSIIYTDTIAFDRTRHMVQQYLDMARNTGAKIIIDKLVPLETSPADKKAVDKFVRENKLKGFVVGIAPGAAESARSRMWPAERFAEVADRLVSEHGAKIIFIGSPGEKELIYGIQMQMKHASGSINSAGLLGIKQVFELIRRCKLFIGNDAGLMHVAAAQGVKTIGLFGPNTPALWGPYGKHSIAIYKKPECSPCILNEKGKAPDCLRKTDRYLCMRLIAAEEVMRAVKALKKAF